MLTKHAFAAGLTVAASALMLQACSDGTSEPGIEAHIKAEPMSAGAHADGPTISFRRSDGMRIDLQLGLVNLVPVELAPCANTAARLKTLTDALNPIGTATAHGDSGGEAPAGAIDAAAAAGTEFDLGSLLARPGTYCGLVVELQPGTDSGHDAKHGGTLDTSLDGVAVNVAPCYYPGTVGLSDQDAAAVTAHACIQAKAAPLAKTVTLPFAAPVTLDGRHRMLTLSVAARYEEWFDGIDMTRLATDSTEQDRLAGNIAAALHVRTGEEQNVRLAFDIRVNGSQAMCGGVYDGVGSGAQQDYELRDFRFYVSDLHLHGSDGTVPLRLAARADGTVYQDASHGVALLGLVQGCDAPTTVRVLDIAGTAASGDYDELCFSLGLPFALNHLDAATAPSPLSSTAMAWSWLSGRKFVRVDGIGDADGARRNFFVHLGSTGCTNGSGTSSAPPDGVCGQPNLAEVCLDYATIKGGARIVADIAPVLAEVDITTNTDGTAPGCMSGGSDPECVTVLPRFGLDFLYNGELLPRQAQQFFAVVP